MSFIFFPNTTCRKENIKEGSFLLVFSLCTSQRPTTVHDCPPSTIKNPADQTLNGRNIHHLGIPIFILVVVHIEVIYTLYRAIFDRSEDNVLRLVEIQVLRCRQSDQENVLDLAVKSLEFEFRFLPPLVRKLVDI
jgi:hypothetical protein